MNRKISPLLAFPIVLAAIGAALFIYSRMPTGMVVHMTAHPPGVLSGTFKGSRVGSPRPRLAIANHKVQIKPTSKIPSDRPLP